MRGLNKAFLALFALSATYAMAGSDADYNRDISELDKANRELIRIEKDLWNLQKQYLKFSKRKINNGRLPEPYSSEWARESGVWNRRLNAFKDAMKDSALACPGILNVKTDLDKTRCSLEFISITLFSLWTSINQRFGGRGVSGNPEEHIQWAKKEIMEAKKDYKAAIKAGGGK